MNSLQCVLLLLLYAFGESVMMSSRPIHDFHLSRCEIDYNAEEETLQIAIQVFIDDLEASLKKEGYSDLKILTDHESVLADSLISDYINRNVVMMINEQNVKLDFFGKEMSDDFQAMWSYFIVPEVEAPQVFYIQNSILFEEFDDQKNVVVVKLSPQLEGHFLFEKDDNIGHLPSK